MRFVKTRSEIVENLRYLRTSLRKGGEEAAFARARLALGICFVVEKLEGETFFGPSRFVGYHSNRAGKHRGNKSKHGSRTNAVLTNILKGPPLADRRLQVEYERFLRRHGILPQDAPFQGARKFWNQLPGQRTSARAPRNAD